jgi:hypothetical protein
VFWLAKKKFYILGEQLFPLQIIHAEKKINNVGLLHRSSARNASA